MTKTSLPQRKITHVISTIPFLNHYDPYSSVLKRASIPFSTLDDFVVPLTKTAAILAIELSWPAGLNPQSDLPVTNAVEFLADSLAAQAKLPAEKSDQAASKASQSAAVRKGAIMNPSLTKTQKPIKDTKCVYCVPFVPLQLYALLSDQLDPIRHRFWAYKAKLALDGPKALSIDGTLEG